MSKGKTVTLTIIIIIVIYLIHCINICLKSIDCFGKSVHYYDLSIMLLGIALLFPLTLIIEKFIKWIRNNW